MLTLSYKAGAKTYNGLLVFFIFLLGQSLRLWSKSPHTWQPARTRHQTASTQTDRTDTCGNLQEPDIRQLPHRQTGQTHVATCKNQTSDSYHTDRQDRHMWQPARTRHQTTSTQTDRTDTCGNLQEPDITQLPHRQTGQTHVATCKNQTSDSFHTDRQDRHTWQPARTRHQTVSTQTDRQTDRQTGQTHVATCKNQTSDSFHTDRQDRHMWQPART